jgi:hypothetical protein
VCLLAKELLARLGKLWVLKSRAKAARRLQVMAYRKRRRDYIFLVLKSDAAATSANSPLQALLCALLHSCPSSLLSAVFKNPIWRKGLERCKWQCRAVP